MRQVPSQDLESLHRPIREEIYAAIHRVVDANAFVLGAEVAALEKNVATYCQAKHCVGVTSGTDALVIALMALDMRPGDEIITSPFTFFATAGAIARVGARPVFADIEPGTFNLNPGAVARRITSRTRAILPIHLYGQCVDMDPLLGLARRHGLFVVEDAAQAIGAEYRGRRAGSLGTIGCFSFFPGKNLGAMDGGAVTTNDERLAEKLRCLRVHGASPKYYHRQIGGNFRLDAMQAAVLNVKLRHLDRWTQRRQEAAARYEQLLTEFCVGAELVQPPLQAANRRHVFNQFVVRAQHRDRLRETLTRHQISTAIYYPLPMHLQECFADLGHRRGDFPVSEQAADECLALPIYPDLDADQQRLVVQCIAEHYAASQQQDEKAA